MKNLLFSFVAKYQFYLPLTYDNKFFINYDEVYEILIGKRESDKIYN